MMMDTKTHVGRRSLLGASLFLLFAAVTVPAIAQPAQLSGQQLYLKQCASCHGDQGQGVEDEYPDALIGKRSLASLTAYIDKRMPEGDAKACVGPDAQKVAQYIFDAFYSPAAQAKKNTPKIELARLTATQHQNALADLFGSFRPAAKPSKGHGLEGAYSNSGRRFRDDKIMLRRIDATIDFDFGHEAPDAKVAKEEFAIRWTGGLRVERSGDYELIVQTKNGMRLYFNGEPQPLIDAWVRSGDSTIYRESVRLLGGRTYPIRLEIFKEKKEKMSAVSLRWKQPQQLEQVIGSEALVPGEYEPVYVVSTAFPSDDRSMGYERGTFISKAWDEATTDAALDAAAYVLANLSDLSRVRTRDESARQPLMQFVEQLAERAFRRPLTPALRQFFVERHFKDQADLDLAVKQAVLLILKSPRFLYHEAGLASDQFSVAARMSFGLWDSLPDQELTGAAKAGKLASHDQIITQLRRMRDDPRSRTKLNSFFETWLNLDRMHELSKDAKEYPQFTPAVVADLRTSLAMFLDDVIWNKESDLRKLMTADHLYLNGPLAAIYGVDLPSDAPFQKVSVKHRAGILTHPLLMAGFAYEGTTSPIHRGVFVSRNLLGRRLRPPPEAIAPLSPDLHPDMTTRQRTIVQTSDKTCMSCHGMINPLGFTFEHFDAVGRFREMEKQRPIDAAGFYETASGDVAKFDSAADLAAFLIKSEEAQAAFIERLFHHAIKQPVLAYGYDTPEKWRQYFTTHGYHITDLWLELVATASAVP